MVSGTFSSIGDSYAKAIGSLFYHAMHATFIFKIPFLILSVIYSIFLIFISIVFYLLIVIDWLSNIINSVRIVLLNIMENNSCSIDNNLLSFVIRPVVMVLLSPIFFASLFIPKLSGNSISDVLLNESKGVANGMGVFGKIRGVLWGSIGRLFRYVSSSSVLFFPITLPIAIIYSVVLFALGLFFMLLVPLDWLSSLVDSVRVGIVRYVDNSQNSIRYSTPSFLFKPIFLSVLAPVFLALLLIPKLTSQINMS